MKLTTLLDSHRDHASEKGALKDSFGDGYLLKKNRVFAFVRSAALEAGFRFSNSASPSYLALPLSQLDAVMAKKEIPYIDNVSVLDAIEKKIPKLTLWDDISDNLKGNHVFHESCHAVAKAKLQDFTRSANDSPVEQKILGVLLEESFANTCELIAIIDAADQIHRIFFELNSYIFMLDDRANLAAAVKDIGGDVVVRFLLLSYLHANFLKSPDDRDFERMMALTTKGESLDAKNKKTLKALSKIAFKLNPRFREVTTRFYLKLAGINTSVGSLSRFDFLRTLETNAQATHFLSYAGQIV